MCRKGASTPHPNGFLYGKVNSIFFRRVVRLLGNLESLSCARFRCASLNNTPENSLSSTLCSECSRRIQLNYSGRTEARRQHGLLNRGRMSALLAPDTSTGRKEGMTRIASLILSTALLLGSLVSPASGETRQFKIGRSVNGHPIRVVERGDLSSSTKILVVGSIHGNERAGTAVVTRLRRTRALNDVHLFLIRTANPDGMRAGTRQNGRGWI